MAMNSRNANWYALAFGLFSIVMFTGTLYFLFRILEDRASGEWPHTLGAINESYSERTCGFSKSGHTWEARISYRYTVHGSEHHGHRVADSPMYCDSNRGVVLEWLKTNYPLGKEVQVYFNPSDPDAAFLHPGIVNIIDIVMVCVYAIMSALMAYGVIVARRVRASASVTSGATSRYKKRYSFSIAIRGKKP
jgi:hypothetical protein